MLNTVEFTNTGLDLLSAASATKSIVIDHIYCLDHILDTETFIGITPAELVAEQMSGVTASVVSVGIDPNSGTLSRIIVALSLNSVTTSKTVRTLMVTAHYDDAGSASQEVTFFGFSDSTGIEVPYNSAVPIIQQVAFTFALNRESTITVADSVSNYLLADETSRFITTHSVNSTIAGDRQRIFGDKIFQDNVVVNKRDAETGILKFTYGDSPRLDVTAKNGAGVQFETHQQAQVLSGILYDFSHEGTLLAGIGTTTADAPINWGTQGTMSVDTLCTRYLVGPSAGDVIMRGNLIPEDNDSVQLGDDAHIWAYAYIGGIEASQIVLNGPLTCEFTSNAIGLNLKVSDTVYAFTQGGFMTGDLFALGTANIVDARITGNLDAGPLKITNGSISVKGDIIPESNNQGYLGATNKRFNAIFGNEISGNKVVASKYSVNGMDVIPQLEPLGGGSVRVGDTVEVLIPKSSLSASGITSPKRFGDTIDVPAGNNFSLGYWAIDGEWSFRTGQDKLPSGRYALKSDLSDITTYTQYVIKLLRLS